MRTKPNLARPDHHGRTAGRTDGCRNESPLEADACFRNRVNIGGSHFVGLVPIGSHPRRGVFGKKPDDIGALIFGQKVAFYDGKNGEGKYGESFHFLRIIRSGFIYASLEWAHGRDGAKYFGIERGSHDPEVEDARFSLPHHLLPYCPE